jgi:hypothetical protein
MTPRALKSLNADGKPIENLTRAFAFDWRKRSTIAEAAKQAVEQLEPLLGQIDNKLPDPIAVTALFQDILERDGPNVGRGWDEAVPIYLALDAMHQAHSRLKRKLPVELQPTLRNLFGKLDFPRHYDSSRSFDPEAIRKKIIELKNTSR